MPGTSSPARYDKKLTVQRLIADPTKDALNNQVEQDLAANWETYHEPFANLVARGGKEFERFGVINSEVSHVISVRKGSETEAITATDRLEFGSRIFQIHGVFVPEGGSREVKIQATEIK